MASTFKDYKNITKDYGDSMNPVNENYEIWREKLPDLVQAEPGDNPKFPEDGFPAGLLPSDGLKKSEPYIINPVGRNIGSLKIVGHEDTFAAALERQKQIERQQFLDTATLSVVRETAVDGKYDPAAVNEKIEKLGAYYDEYNSIMDEYGSTPEALDKLVELKEKYGEDTVALFDNINEEIADYNADKAACELYPANRAKLAELYKEHPDAAYAHGDINAEVYKKWTGTEYESSDPEVPYIDNTPDELKPPKLEEMPEIIGPYRPNESKPEVITGPYRPDRDGQGTVVYYNAKSNDFDRDAYTEAELANNKVFEPDDLGLDLDSYDA